MFYHRNLIYSPIDFLSENRQNYYDFKIVGKKKYKGKIVIVMKADPKSSQDSTRLSGKIWINKVSHSILKIEWEQKSLENIERIEKTARKLRAKPRITLTTEYGLEKNGILFPSKHFVREEYIRMGNRAIFSETTINYDNYKFFIVDIEYK